jgi:hypothetical protein
VLRNISNLSNIQVKKMTEEDFKSKKEDINKQIELITNSERHFNELETEYRKLASTWLLGALGAIGFILQAQNLPIDKWYLVMGICWAASVGIYVLYILDLEVYHALLDAFFTEGVKLEVKYFPWVLPIRMSMLKSQNLKGVIYKVLFYYFLSICLLMLISIFAIWFSQISSEKLWIQGAITIIVVTICYILYKYMMFKAAPNPKIVDLIKQFDALDENISF